MMLIRISRNALCTPDIANWCIKILCCVCDTISISSAINGVIMVTICMWVCTLQCDVCES